MSSHLILNVIELAHPVHELVDAVELCPGADAVPLVVACGRVKARKAVAVLFEKKVNSCLTLNFLHLQFYTY